MANAKENISTRDEVMEVEKAMWLLGEVDTSDDEIYGKSDSVEVPLTPSQKKKNDFERFAHEHNQAKHNRAKKVSKDSKDHHLKRVSKKIKKQANDKVRAELKNVRSELASIAKKKEALETELSDGSLTFDAYEGTCENYELVCSNEHDLKLAEMRLARSSPNTRVSRSDLKNS